MKSAFKSYSLILLGVISATIGLKCFIIPVHFIDGGVTGLSLILRHITGIPLGYFIFIINLPFVILGYYQVGKVFSFRTLIGIGLLALLLILFPQYPLTEEKLLVAVFGGLLLGAGIGFAMRGGAVIDGTEVLAVYLSRKTTMTIGDIILVLNIGVFAIGAYFLDVNSALYSMITYLVAGRTVNYVVSGVEEYTGVTIISKEPDKIRHNLIKEMGRGVTVYYGRGGYTERKPDNDQEILYTVITRLELSKLKKIVEDEDEKAFIITHTVNDTYGGMIKRRPLH